MARSFLPHTPGTPSRPLSPHPAGRALGQCWGEHTLQSAPSPKGASHHPCRWPCCCPSKHLAWCGQREPGDSAGQLLMWGAGTPRLPTCPGLVLPCPPLPSLPPPFSPSLLSPSGAGPHRNHMLPDFLSEAPRPDPSSPAVSTSPEARGGRRVAGLRFGASGRACPELGSKSRAPGAPTGDRDRSTRQGWPSRGGGRTETRWPSLAGVPWTSL